MYQYGRNLEVYYVSDFFFVTLVWRIALTASS